MHVRGHLTGVVYLASRKRCGFVADELQLLEMVASRIGTKIENAALYEQALAAIRSRDTVLGFVSHDLRNPLSTIMMCTEMISDDPKLERPVGIIKRATTVMVRLISDLRDVGSLEAGTLTIRTRPESPARLVAEVIEEITRLAADKSIQIIVRLAGDRAVECDRIRIIQVLTNLMSNAIKFTPTGGSITLSMETEPTHARFTIADTGSGISQGELSRVFDRYWQASVTAHLGTGLGLAIAKGIIDAHGGKISVTSRVGHGSAFTFTLRYADDVESAQPKSGARVLVVDDDVNALSALASLLELEGLVVATATDGLEALSKLHAFAPDVLVVDVEMPVLKGDDLARTIRNDFPELPIILMSGHDDQVVAAARRELGAGYVAKPIDLAELISTIHREVGRAQERTASIRVPPPDRSPSSRR